MINIFEAIYDNTFYFVIEFIKRILGRYSISLTDIPIRIGFGNVEWINSNMLEVLMLVSTIIIGFIFIRLVYKVLKFFTRLVTRAFGGL